MLMMSGNVHGMTDGFMLNFAAVLLRLSKPFCTPFSSKLLKIDPRYCLASSLALDANYDSDGVHIHGLKDETKLILSKETTDANVETQLRSISFNFMTECFFATHRALYLGFKAVHERFLKLTQELGQIQRVYEEARLQST